LIIFERALVPALVLPAKDVGTDLEKVDQVLARFDRGLKAMLVIQAHAEPGGRAKIVQLIILCQGGAGRSGANSTCPTGGSMQCMILSLAKLHLLRGFFPR
jgi:hypothetical protein